MVTGQKVFIKTAITVEKPTVVVVLSFFTQILYLHYITYVNIIKV